MTNNYRWVRRFAWTPKRMGSVFDGYDGPVVWLAPFHEMETIKKVSPQGVVWGATNGGPTYAVKPLEQ